MENNKKLPIGIEHFEEIRTEGFYYVDKTAFIKELLDSWGKVNLFTRPRRFGKSLNMNMLQYFFAYGCKPGLFDGLSISREKEYCEKYMGKFPVISVTLKGVSALNFEGAKGMLRNIVGNEALRFQFLLESEKLRGTDKKQYGKIIELSTDSSRNFAMSDELLADSLHLLCSLLHRHYDRKPILLIDEYDVPLDKAQQYGYYDEMVTLLRNLFGQALKTNDSLHFAVLTGCLRIAKESIFTGLNNLKVFSVTDVRFATHFGFTSGEVLQMLKDYGAEDKYDLVRKWYDGYHFGDTDMYCPWDVINYVDLLITEPAAPPRAFWVNTSGNNIIRKFIRMSAPQARREIEALVAGETVVRRINQELTYRDLYQNADNLWSVLFATGYLTLREGPEPEELPAGASLRETYLAGGLPLYRLAIPNLEIRQIFVEQILEWFQEEVQRDAPRLDAFCAAFLQGDAETIEESFRSYLRKTISIRDTSVRKTRKENFYHGILLGLLSHREEWIITSNAESGDGYSDILVEAEEEDVGIVIEIKYLDTKKRYPDDNDFEKTCREAMTQIEQMEYASRLEEDGLKKVLAYGIACYKKKCRVLAKRLR